MTSWLAVAGPLIGGIGLFLLGMAMMTDGLKLAAGPALARILGRATRTRAQALGAGVLVTTLVQSSSAVTVATIGFVNAGLLMLPAALWVLFGANVGTTMTGWIVAMVGLKFKIEALALPLVGLGVALQLVRRGQRAGALGTALAGFGLLFLGIAMLQGSFAGLAERFTLPQGHGPLSVLAQLGAGVLLTVLMQSSSAAMTITLTAAHGGLIDAQGAAAVVIGANVGTTVTAVLAALGATPNARRAAAAHVVFNLLTGAVALALLPWLIGAIAALGDALELPPDPATQLALFHTIFNVLGVLLMWPLAARLTRWLQQRFRQREEDEAQPRFLDDTVLAVPALAVQALRREVARVGGYALQALRRALSGADAAALAPEHDVVRALDTAAERFVERMHRETMAPATSRELARTLRVLRYHETTAEQSLLAGGLDAAPALADAAVAAAQVAFAAVAGQVLDRCAAVHEALGAGHPGGFDPGGSELRMPLALPAPPDAALLARAETAYQTLKAELLAAGAAGRLALAPMEAALRRASALRRGLQQAEKAAVAMAAEGVDPDPHAAALAAL